MSSCESDHIPVIPNPNGGSRVLYIRSHRNTNKKNKNKDNEENKNKSNDKKA